MKVLTKTRGQSGGNSSSDLGQQMTYDYNTFRGVPLDSAPS